MINEEIKRLLLSTKRIGVESLILEMTKRGFFESPCSSQYHLCKPGGLAEHSYNVYITAKRMAEDLCESIPEDSLILVCLLHDLGKMGQFGKPNYKQNFLADGTQSKKKPYVSNHDLMYVDHEIRSIVIAQEHIDLTEEEQQAILWHNGLYGTFKYQIQGKEFPLYLLLNFADMWASRVIEVEDEIQRTES